MRVIGLGYTARVGKDTVADYLVGEWGFRKVSLADPVRELALAINPHVWTWDGDIVKLSEMVDEIGWEAAKGDPSVRRILIGIGEGARNVIDPDVWLKAMTNQLRKGGTDDDRIVISDVRYANEASWVRRNNGTLVRIQRDHSPPPMKGERLTPNDFDYQLPNNGSIDRLYELTDRMMEKLKFAQQLKLT